MDVPALQMEAGVLSAGLFVHRNVIIFFIMVIIIFFLFDHVIVTITKTITITNMIRNSVAMEAEKKAAALKAAALVDKPPHALIAVTEIFIPR